MRNIKLNTTLFTSLIVAVLYTSTSVAAIPAMELVKAEPIETISLKIAAKDSLMKSFSDTSINVSFNKILAKNNFAQQKSQLNKSELPGSTKTSVIAD